ncbi:MAG: hypothetical protein Tsb0015_15380 [Simkaniaceae bacterium]
MTVSSNSDLNSVIALTEVPESSSSNGVSTSLPPSFSFTANVNTLQESPSLELTAEVSTNNPADTNSAPARPEILAKRRVSHLTLEGKSGDGVLQEGAEKVDKGFEKIKGKLEQRLGHEIDLTIDYTYRTIEYTDKTTGKTVKKDIKMMKKGSDDDQYIAKEFKEMKKALLEAHPGYEELINGHKFKTGMKGDMKGSEVIRPETDIFTPDGGRFTNNSKRLIPRTFAEMLEKKSNAASASYLEQLLSQSGGRKTEVAKRIVFMNAAMKKMAEKIQNRMENLMQDITSNPNAADIDEKKKRLSDLNKLSESMKNSDEFAMIWALSFMPTEAEITGTALEKREEFYVERAEIAKNELIKTLQAQHKTTGWFGRGEREPVSEEEKAWATSVGRMAIPGGEEESRLASLAYHSDKIDNPSVFAELMIDLSRKFANSSDDSDIAEDKIKEMPLVKELGLTDTIVQDLVGILKGLHNDLKDGPQHSLLSETDPKKLSKNMQKVSGDLMKPPAKPQNTPAPAPTPVNSNLNPYIGDEDL